MHEGHRQRMLERANNPETLQDHELLEILLFNPIPRKNTNEIAHRLLSAFGSLKNVFDATIGELMGIDGVGAATARYLKCVGDAFRRTSEQEVPMPRAFNFHDFHKVLAERFCGLTEEYIDLFGLDANDRIRAVVRFTSHEGDHAEISFSEITNFFLAHKPVGLVVAHNHPHRSGQPSPQDDAFTARLQMLCSMNGIKLRDHLIYSEEETYSYFMHGRLEDLEKAFNVEELMRERRIL